MLIYVFNRNVKMCRTSGQTVGQGSYYVVESLFGKFVISIFILERRIPYSVVNESKNCTLAEPIVLL